MDNTQQPLTPQPQVPTEPVIPTEGHSKTPLLLVGGIFFLLLIAGMIYYILQPQPGSEDTTYEGVATASPTPTAVAQTAEEQDVEAAVSYSLDDSFAELEKDLEGL